MDGVTVLGDAYHSLPRTGTCFHVFLYPSHMQGQGQAEPTFERVSLGLYHPWACAMTPWAGNPDDPSQFFGHKDTISIFTIVGKRWTRGKPKTGIQSTCRQKKIHGARFETHP